MHLVRALVLVERVAVAVAEAEEKEECEGEVAVRCWVRRRKPA